MLRRSPIDRESLSDSESDEQPAGQHAVVTVSHGIISQPAEETTSLLKKAAYRSATASKYGSFQDLESLKAVKPASSLPRSSNTRQFRAGPCQILQKALHPSKWSAEDIWTQGIRRPLSFVPPIVLGLLLNVLDALSYGMSRNLQIDAQGLPSQA